MNRPLRVGLLPMLASLVLAAGPGRAEDLALKDGLARLAKKLVEVIRQEGGGGDSMAVVMGDFVGAPRLKAAGGAGLAALLTGALEAENVAGGHYAFPVAGCRSASRFLTSPHRTYAYIGLRVACEAE